MGTGFCSVFGLPLSLPQPRPGSAPTPVPPHIKAGPGRPVGCGRSPAGRSRASGSGWGCDVHPAVGAHPRHFPRNTSKSIRKLSAHAVPSRATANYLTTKPAFTPVHVFPAWVRPTPDHYRVIGCRLFRRVPLPCGAARVRTASGEVGARLCLGPGGRNRSGVGSTGLPAPEPGSAGTGGGGRPRRERRGSGTGGCT